MKTYDLVVLQASESTKSDVANKIRPLGPEKVVWAAEQAGYRAVCVSRLSNLSLEEALELVAPLVGPNTVLGVSTSLLLHSIYVGAPSTALSKLVELVGRLRVAHSNPVLLGGPSAAEFVSHFSQADVLDDADGELAIGRYLDKKLNRGIAKSLVPWSITTDNFSFSPTSFIQTGEMLPLELSRGCVFSCKFCSFNRIGKAKGTYEKPLELVRAHLLDNYEKYGTTHYYLTSDTVNDNDERMNAWCDMLETLPFQVTYAGYFRLDLLNKHRNTARRLFDSGLRGLNLGVETFNENAARLIEKPFSGRRAKDALLDLHYEVFKQQALISIGLIIGLPLDTEASLLESVQWLKTEGKPIEPSFNVLNLPCPVRGPKGFAYSSKFSKSAESYGLRWPKEDVNYWEHETMTKSKAVKLYLRLSPQFKLVGNWNFVQRLASAKQPNFLADYFSAVKTLSLKGASM